MNKLKEQIFLNCSKPHYNLRTPKGVKPSAIYLILNLGGKQYKVSTNVKVIPAQWVKKEYKAMVSSSLSELENVNNMVVNKKILEYNLLYSSLIDYLCNHIEEIKEPLNAIQTIFGMKKRTVKKEKISATLYTALRNHKMSEDSYNIFYGQLKEFVEWLDNNHSNISLNELTSDIYKGYKEFLFNKKITHKITGVKVCAENNTVLTKLKNLITIIGYLDDTEELCTKLKKVLKDIRTFKQEENQVFIDDNEIEAIYNLELEGEEEIARDLFIFQLSSGQRYSDISKLCGIDLKEGINGDTISIVQKKTKTKVSFPVNEKAKSVLEKYCYKLPKLSNDKINKAIKKVCEKAGICEMCHCVELRGGDTYEYDAEKHKLIGTHTTRRSFISNAIKENIDASIIRKISGHKTTSAFERYNRIDSEDAVQAMLKAKNTSKTSGNGSGSASNDNGGTTTHNNDNRALQNEIKLVLAMFDVPSYEWIEVDDIEELYRLLIINETKICDKVGCSYSVLKDLFNDKNLSLKEKVEVVKGMLNKK